MSQPTRAIRALSFDAGGTLLTPCPSPGHVYAEVAARHGFPDLSPTELDRRFAQLWPSHTRNGFDYTRAAWAELADVVFAGLIESRPSATSLFTALYERFADPDVWHVYPDVRPTLCALRAAGLPLAVISNWDDRLRPLLARLELTPLLDVLVISSEVGVAKPAPAIFHHAAARLGVPAPEILHIGDDPRSDYRGALDAGFQAALLHRGPPQPLSPHHIRSLDAVLATAISPSRATVRVANLRD
jgi:putative hydrolase of the HAD superfamily